MLVHGLATSMEPPTRIYEPYFIKFIGRKARASSLPDGKPQN
ncbi:hypothetical protein ADU37_CDS01210 [Thermococcus sp. 2319x1]|nr:hypothetical protein ADU37_CDS01210 [Thermococcus sp. 2319x1]